MRLSTEIEKADLERLFAHQRGSESSGGFYGIVRWWVLALLGVMVLLRALQDVASPGTLAWAALFVAWLVAGKRWLAWLTGRFTSQALSRHDFSSHLGAQTLAVQEDGLHYESASGSGVISWPAVKRVETDKDHTFIYLSDVSALIVPHRCGPPDEVAAFLSAVRARAAA